MWQVDNKTPFAHHAAPMRDHRGQSLWSVWIAATFVLRPRHAPLFAMPQPPVAMAPRFDGDNPESVMLADSDITPPRNRIDLTLGGTVPDTGGRDHRVLFRIGTWQKTLEISGDGHRHGPLPLDGTFAARSEDMPIGRAKDDPNGPPCVTVAGGGHPALGPVPRHWPARDALSGTYDDVWRRTRAPLLPTDIDPDYWQAAPLDQQLERPLAEGVALEIGGLGGTGPAEAPTPWPLPWLALRTDTRIAGSWVRGAPELQSIAVNLDTGRVRLVYQAAWPIPRAGDDVKIQKTLIALRDGAGFRVTSSDAPRFDPATSLKEYVQ
ncbi:DUF2169 domain-containing protein [Tateyamaria omphalii]|uniref:DUF2169 domain-containing protein n=1 Tax=Tateyamaria omphalii TaxID=299262 RepID=UPI001C993CB3|nr:DUF2169 domain-containing protein [Tateyamaria omphalii]MBY5931937.1 DUF2169 domain-containing protein [Tateyamaria omphalii]